MKSQGNSQNTYLECFGAMRDEWIFPLARFTSTITQNTRGSCVSLAPTLPGSTDTRE